jgi:hypothetical protein
MTAGCAYDWCVSHETAADSSTGSGDGMNEPWVHPEATLRGRMVREVWDARPWITYSDAKAVVEALSTMPELADLLAKEEDVG